MATLKNPAAGRVWLAGLALAVGGLAGPGPVGAAAPVARSAGEEEVVRVRSLPPRPERLYQEAKARWSPTSTNATDCWQFGRACFDLAEYASNQTQRAALATEGIEACRRSLQLFPSNAPAYFFLGLNYGQLARTKLLGALSLVKEMQGAWEKAIELDPLYDHAGPHRALGILYRDAPGWPVSIGSKAKARWHLLKAVELAPGYPGNQLSLLESHARWGEYRLLQQQRAATAQLMQEARLQFRGEEWALDWKEWDRLWAQLQKNSAVTNARSPRER